MLRHPIVHAVAAALLGAVFLYASWDKIAKPADFARIVYHYRLLGPNAQLGYVPANVLAVTLPWIELVTGLALVLGVWRREAAIVAAGMLTVFVFAVGYALWQGIDIANCGCFSVGGDGRAAGSRLIAGDLALLAVAVYVALVKPSPRVPIGAGPEADVAMPSAAVPPA